MLVVAQPMTAAIALVYLLLVAFVVNHFVTRRALEAGRVNRDASYRVAIFMTEMVEALKEITLRNKLDEVAVVVTEERKRAVRARANSSFLGVIPKYAFEAALVGGFLLVGGGAYLIAGPEEAIVSIALFAVAGFRLIPAINGIQSGIIQATATIPSANDVIGDMTNAERDVEERLKPDRAELPKDPRTLQLDAVRFRYPASSEDVLRGMTSTSRSEARSASSGPPARANPPSSISSWG